MKLRKLFGIPEKITMTASIARRKCEYGTDRSFEEILKYKIREIEGAIDDKISFSKAERILIRYVPSGQKLIYDKLKEVFTERGYEVFYLTSEQIPALKNNIYIGISWDVTDPTEETFPIENL